MTEFLGPPTTGSADEHHQNTETNAPISIKQSLISDAIDIGVLVMEL